MPIFMCIFNIDIYRDLMLGGDKKKKWEKPKIKRDTVNLKRTLGENKFQATSLKHNFIFFSKEALNVCFDFAFLHI